jgi:release factor glutamine methyltransferase
VADARLEARILVEEATGLAHAGVMRATDPVGPEVSAKLEGWLARRLAGEPVFRIIGQREFWGLPLTVTHAVLDPRPDTETVVDAALAALGPRRHAALRMCDLGVGSGAILAALLTECRAARGWGVDRSFAACGVARGNFVSIGVGERAIVLQGSWGDALPSGGFDLLVSNPPYVVSAEIAHLDREVRDHDPHLALDGGADGLVCYRAIICDLPRLLVPGGVAVLELGAGQAAAVQDLGMAAGLDILGTRADLAGHDRALIVRRSP